MWSMHPLLSAQPFRALVERLSTRTGEMALFSQCVPPSAFRRKVAFRQEHRRDTPTTSIGGRCLTGFSAEGGSRETPERPQRERERPKEVPKKPHEPRPGSSRTARTDMFWTEVFCRVRLAGVPRCVSAAYVVRQLWFDYRSKHTMSLPCHGCRYATVLPYAEHNLYFRIQTHAAQVDVYSYAMILFEIICREIPFEDDLIGRVGSPRCGFFAPIACLSRVLYCLEHIPHCSADVNVRQ